MNPQFREFKSRFREMTLAAYQQHCDSIAQDCAGIQDDTERKHCEEALSKIRRWFKYRQDFAPDIVREIATIERGLQ
jgi:hypothetical protein